MGSLRKWNWILLVGPFFLWHCQSSDKNPTQPKVDSGHSGLNQHARLGLLSGVYVVGGNDVCYLLPDSGAMNCAVYGNTPVSLHARVSDSVQGSIRVVGAGAPLYPGGPYPLTDSGLVSTTYHIEVISPSDSLLGTYPLTIFRKNGPKVGLTSLRITPGSLFPPLDSLATMFTDTADGGIRKVLLEASAADTNIREIRLNEKRFKGNTIKDTLTLHPGMTDTWTIRVVAGIGNQKEYLVSIYSKSNDASIKSIRIFPDSVEVGGNQDSLEYYANVDYVTDSLRIAATPEHPGATVTLLDGSAPMAGLSKSIHLVHGPNKAIGITIMAEDRLTVKDYKLHVVRDRGFERYFMDSGYFAVGIKVFPTSDGGYFLLGQDANRAVPYLFKTDDAGRVEWSKPVLSQRPSYLNSMEQTADGAYLLAGRMTAANDRNNWADYRLLKVGNSGSVEWEKGYGDGSNENLYAIRKTADGGYIAGGGTTNYGNASIAMRLTATGDTVWVRHYDVQSSGLWYAFDRIFQASDGGYIVSGTIPSKDAAKPRDAQELYLGKLNADGSLLWVRYFGLNSTIGGEAVETDDGGFLIVGATIGSAETDIYLVKTDKDGKKEWEKTYPRAGVRYANMVQRSHQGDYFIAGTATDSNGGNPSKFKPYLLKIDASGTELWSRVYGGGREGSLTSVHETSDGGIVAVGSVRKTFPATSSAVFLLKADANGESR